MATRAATEPQDDYEQIVDLLHQINESERERRVAMDRFRAVAAEARAGSERLRQALPDLFQ